MRFLTTFFPLSLGATVNAQRFHLSPDEWKCSQNEIRPEGCSTVGKTDDGSIFCSAENNRDGNQLVSPFYNYISAS
jgi:hypothetical protein